MKIEKINDNQIRCTLTSEDLATRNIKLSELAYGSEKAKALFRDMMQQAAIDFGFEAEDIPIMVEAIPLSSEKIVLIISKVESPDELDLRFSNFTQANSDDDEETANSDFEHFTDDSESEPDETAMQLLDLLQRLKRENAQPETAQTPKKESSAIPTDMPRLFTFRKLDDAVLAADTLQGFYQGKNTLYKNPQEHTYHLIVHQSQHTISEFNRVINLICSYLKPQKYTAGLQAFYEEHFQKIIRGNALQQLGKIT